MRAFLLLLAFATPAIAQDAAFLKCRAIKDSAARLACYDALPVPPAASAPAAPAAATAAKPGTAAASASTAQTGAPAALPSEPAAQFGLAQKDREKPLDAIESTIPGRFEGWGPRERFRLANGQVWQVADDSKGYHDITNPKVRVRRGALGAFYLEIEGTNRSPRVTRVQ